MIKVTIYNEYMHEKEEGSKPQEIYSKGIHNALKDALDEEFLVRTVTLDDIESGLSEEVLADTDVLIWWGHMAHHLVPDEVVERAKRAVLDGMGAIFLHSGHHSKLFMSLMGTCCNLNWREDGDREFLWVCNPSHPIAQGIDRYIYIKNEETYGEPFGIPEPDELVFIANFEGGEVFRGGCCWKRENGKIFYFQPGHETFPIYYDPQIIKVIKNAIRWAAPIYRNRIDGPWVTKPEER